MHPKASYESKAQPGTLQIYTNKTRHPKLNRLDERHAADEDTLTCLCLILAGKQAAAGI